MNEDTLGDLNDETLPLPEQEVDTDWRYPVRNCKSPTRLLNPITYLGKAFIVLLDGHFGDTMLPDTPYLYSQVTDSLRNSSGVTEQLYHHLNVINMNAGGTFNDIHPLSNIAKND